MSCFKQWMPWLIVGSLAACEDPERAPLDLEEAAVQAFVGFDTLPAEELTLVVGDLNTAMSGLDYTGDREARSFEIERYFGTAASAEEVEAVLEDLDEDQIDLDEEGNPTLSPETALVGDLELPEGTTPADQLGMVVFAMSEQPLADHFALLREANTICIDSETTKYGLRDYGDDLDAFLAGTTDTLSSVTPVRKENILAKVWFLLHKKYRRVTLPDGREAMLARSWTERVYVADGGSNSWSQNFTVEAWLPTDDDSAVKRLYGGWLDIKLGLPKDGIRGIVLDGLAETLDWQETWMATGENADCKLEREPDLTPPDDL